MSERKITISLTGPEGILDSMADALRSEGYRVFAPSATLDEMLSELNARPCKASPPDGACPNHRGVFCCPECPDVSATDGLGFPHPSERGLREPLQRCSHCGRMVRRQQWVHHPLTGYFGCRGCRRIKERKS